MHDPNYASLRSAILSFWNDVPRPVFFLYVTALVGALCLRIAIRIAIRVAAVLAALISLSYAMPLYRQFRKDWFEKTMRHCGESSICFSFYPALVTFAQTFIMSFIAGFVILH